MSIHLKAIPSDISIQTLSPDRSQKNMSKRKWRWFEELRQERERDINIEMSETLRHHSTRNQ
jgi:hypothetical protein